MFAYLPHLYLFCLHTVQILRYFHKHRFMDVNKLVFFFTFEINNQFEYQTRLLQYGN